MTVRLSNAIWDWILGLVFFAFFPFSVILGLYYPAVILDQGVSHRIFYFHVPVAWVALYGPVISSFCAVVYLWKKEQIWDTLSVSANKISLLFAVGVLFSGPIWAYSAWGTPWDFTDARLQSFFVLVLSLVAYFLLRGLVLDSSKKYVFSSFLSLICTANAIMTWGAIRWVENPGNHPESVLGKGGMDPDMRAAFWAGVLGYHLLFLVLYRLVYRLDKSFAIREELPLDEE
ncbi:cytochrome c assembly protein [Leptospira broomii serovar Hurstbridge str. 5399]|uniref:Heme exporter protein C n=1 Tax=Leptospira broomii serovar Hurstbridge str. 5399 TaxID=1049789 RepID=T0FC94_9LEPT|nr:cytochrome c biogenesis protein CcsA [Leptospira broomii]EQA45486.1 cytochrome c assembly protein [Leptospira broomii serovar Hurstbridge str. 5399]